MEKINIQKLQSLLEQKGDTQVEFASAIDAKPSLISAAFHGNRDIPMRKILKIAKYFSVSPFELVIENDTKQTHQESNTNQTQKVS